MTHTHTHINKYVGLLLEYICVCDVAEPPFSRRAHFKEEITASKNKERHINVVRPLWDDQKPSLLFMEIIGVKAPGSYSVSIRFAFARDRNLTCP